MDTKTLQFAPKSVMNRKDMDIRAGDTVRVHLKIQEKGKTRIQIFEGLVLATKHGTEPGATFTVRKVSNSVGVERIFPLYSPMIEKIEIVKRSNMRRSKLYYLRNKTTRAMRRKMRNFIEFFASTDDLAKEQDEALKEMPDVVEEEKTEEAPAETETSPEEAPADDTKEEAETLAEEEKPAEETPAETKEEKTEE
jgi:large subunit ribosomal protein L19